MTPFGFTATAWNDWVLHFNWKKIRRNHWVQAVIVGLISLGASLLIYWVLWKWWYELPPITAQGYSSEYRTLELGFGQTVASYLTVLIAGALGWYAIKEFLEKHELTSLEVSFPNAYPSVDGYPIYMTLGGSYLFSVRVRNSGAISVSSFVIKIETRFLRQSWEMAGYPRLPDRTSVNTFLGKYMTTYEGDIVKNWSIRTELKVFDDPEKFEIQTWHSLIFRSNDALTIYPGETVNLFVIEIPPTYVTRNQFYNIEFETNGVNCKPLKDVFRVKFIDFAVETIAENRESSIHENGREVVEEAATPSPSESTIDSGTRSDSKTEEVQS